MCDPINLISAIATIAGTVKSFTGGGGHSDQVQLPAPTPVPQAASLKAPPGTFPGPDRSGATTQLPGLQGMTPQQQRARIATFGVQGGQTGSTYSSDQAQQYYKNLVLQDLVGEGGGAIKPDQSFLPIEKQYISQTLGKQTYDDSTGSFLDALLRQ